MNEPVQVTHNDTMKVVNCHHTKTPTLKIKKNKKEEKICYKTQRELNTRLVCKISPRKAMHHFHHLHHWYKKHTQHTLS